MPLGPNMLHRAGTKAQPTRPLRPWRHWGHKRPCTVRDQFWAALAMTKQSLFRIQKTPKLLIKLDVIKIYFLGIVLYLLEQPGFGAILRPCIGHHSLNLAFSPSLDKRIYSLCSLVKHLEASNWIFENYVADDKPPPPRAKFARALHLGISGFNLKMFYLFMMIALSLALKIYYLISMLDIRATINCIP